MFRLKKAWFVLIVLGISTLLVTAFVWGAEKRALLTDFSVEVDKQLIDGTFDGSWIANDSVWSYGQGGTSRRLASVELEKGVGSFGEYAIKCVMKPAEDVYWHSFQFRANGYWTFDNWDPNGCIYYWVKGDGSGKHMIARIDVPGIATFNAVSMPIVLDSTEWKVYAIPFEAFQSPEGQKMTALWDWIYDVFAVELANWQGHDADFDVVFYVDKIEVDVL